METTELISYLFGGIGMLIGLSGWIRTKRNDGKSDGVMLTEIGYVKAGVDDIKRKQEKQDLDHIEVMTRLVAVEASTKQAHHRLDRAEGKTY